MTLRTLGRYGQRHKEADHSYMKYVYEYITTDGKGFLLCPYFSEQCNHEWKVLDAGYACCTICGTGHDCNKGKCPEAYGEYTQRVCTITGCVTCESEFRAEKDAFERVGHVNSIINEKVNCPIDCKKTALNGSDRRKNKRQKFHDSESHRGIESLYVLCVFENNTSRFHEVIRNVVTEILLSEKTQVCFIQEIKRNEAKTVCILSKLLREYAHNRTCPRPNMCDILSQIHFSIKKCRMHYTEFDQERSIQIKGIIKKCCISIANLLLMHGRQRVARQMQNSFRCREFICSMLYLMRMGITFQNRQLLPKMEILNEYLPLQVLLPIVFKIRAKSITEGENIIKLDIRKMPLI